MRIALFSDTDNVSYEQIKQKSGHDVWKLQRDRPQTHLRWAKVEQLLSF